MALPGDVTTFTLTFGPYTDASGAVVTTKNAKGDPLTAKLHAIDLATGRRLNVTDVATGQVVVPKDLTVTIGSDGTGSIGPLPHTDNPGLSTVGFGYYIEWDIASGSHSYTPGNKRFAVPTASGSTVDFDLLDVAEAVPGVLVPIGTGPQGPTGPAGPQGDPGEVTDAELAAGLATKVSTPSGGTDGQALVKNGGAVEWGSVATKRLLAVASNGWAGGGASGAQATAGTGEKLHTIGVDCSDLRFIYANFVSSTSVDADGPSAYPIKAALRLGASSIYRAPFRGVATLSLDPGGAAMTDVFAGEFAAQTDIYSRTYINHTAWRPNTGTFVNSGGFTNTTDLTEPGSAVIPTGNKWLFAPSAVVGYPTNPDARAFGIIGDSIAAGVSDFNAFGGNDVNGRPGGWPSRLLWRRAGWINVAVPSDRGDSFLASHHRRLALFDYVTDAICAYGINDLYNASHSLATLQANWIAQWRLMARRGLRSWQATLTPRTTDTAGLLPYTDGKETNRVAANTWLRAGAPLNPTTFAAMTAGAVGSIVAGDTGHPLTGILEVGDVVETARNSGIWKTGFTTDGVHPYGGADSATGATAQIAAALASTPGLFG